MSQHSRSRPPSPKIRLVDARTGRDLWARAPFGGAPPLDDAETLEVQAVHPLREPEVK